MNKDFSFRYLLLVFALTLLTGIAQFAVAWQFNDGKMTPHVAGTVFLGMAFLNVFLGGVMRLARPHLQRYFAMMIVLCLLLALPLLLW